MSRRSAGKPPRGKQQQQQQLRHDPRRPWNFPLTPSPGSSAGLPPPSGFLEDFEFKDSVDYKRQEASNKTELIKQSAMNIATSPGKQVLMTAFMLWMSGSSLQIFSIMMLSMAFWQPLQKLFNVQKAFARYQGTEIDLLLPKLVYILLNLAGVGVALWKANALGLLPTSPTDWVTLRHVQTPLEQSLL